MTKIKIAQGAEAILIKENNLLIKDRIKKSYRLPILDNRLRKQRTKREFKLLEKASRLIPIPNLIKTNEKEKIEMEFIEGKKLSDNLDELPNNLEICKTIGRQIALLHDADIIHGDLTTSNMIYVNVNNNNQDRKKKVVNSNEDISRLDNSANKSIEQDGVTANNSLPFKVYFIDFGLSFESSKIEDKAVDLHLIKQALEAKHFKHYQELFNSVLRGYKISKNHSATLKRLEAVEKRGRYKKQF